MPVNKEDDCLVAFARVNAKMREREEGGERARRIAADGSAGRGGRVGEVRGGVDEADEKIM